MPQISQANAARPGPPGQRRSRSTRTDEVKSASWHVLKYRCFQVYFTGNLISSTGTWLQNTAQILLIYELTHSAFAVGLISCAQFSGFLILGPWAGTLAGRLGNKRVLVFTQFVSAGAAAVLAYMKFNGTLTERPLVIAAVVMGFAFTFALPVQTALVPRLVPEDDTKAAMAMNSVAYNAGRTVAPALCVAIIASVGMVWAFALNAISFIIFAAIVIVIHPNNTPQQDRRGHDWLGLRIAVWHPRILLLLAMVAAVTIADDPVLVLGPALARHVAASSTWPAYFLSVLGLGTVLGALVPTRPPTARRASLPLLALGLSVVLFTAGITVWVSLVAALLAGMAALLTGAATQALLLNSAGPRQTTQVMALWAVAWAGSKPLASLADGWLASNFGIFHTGMILAAPALAIALLELLLREDVKTKLKNYAYAHNGSPTAVSPVR
jgi:predicted MFS family arabinose efflux permease